MSESVLEFPGRHIQQLNSTNKSLLGGNAHRLENVARNCGCDQIHEAPGNTIQAKVFTMRR